MRFCDVTHLPVNYPLRTYQHYALYILLWNVHDISCILCVHSHHPTKCIKHMKNNCTIIYYPYYINDQQTPLERLLSSGNFKLLHDILEELRKVDPVKWEDVTVNDIFPNMLRNSKLLFERCSIPEIACIGKVLESYTGRSFYSTQLSKSRDVNIICKAFEGSNFVQENKRIWQANIISMKTLVQLS